MRVLLPIAAVVALVAIAAALMADSDDSEAYSGTVGPSYQAVHWELQHGHLVLTPAGNTGGSIPDGDESPWKWYRSDITSIYVSKGIRLIGANAFKDLTSLTTVTFESGGLYLRDYVFSGCTNLRQVNFSGSTVNDYFDLGKGVFKDCRSLESVEFLLIYRGLPEETFSGCTSLKSVKIGAWHLSYSGHPPNISNHAFEGCTSLTTVEIPDNTSSIDGYAFQNCTSLKHFTFPSGLEYIGWDAFRGCTSLESIKLPESMRYLDRHAFAGCSSLRRVELNEGLTELGWGCFSGCSLESLTVPDSVTEMDALFAYQVLDIALGSTVKFVKFSSGLTSFDDLWNDGLEVNDFAGKLFHREGDKLVEVDVHTPSETEVVDGYRVTHCTVCGGEISRTPVETNEGGVDVDMIEIGLILAAVALVVAGMFAPPVLVGAGAMGVIAVLRFLGIFTFF